MINTLWGYYRTLNNVYFIRRRSVCETGRCCWWHGDDGGMMMKRSRRDVFLPLLNVKDTHCKSIGPWLQRLSLITSFRAEPGPMSLVWWWNVSFHIRANHKNVSAAHTGDKMIVFKVSIIEQNQLWHSAAAVSITLQESNIWRVHPLGSCDGDTSCRLDCCISCVRENAGVVLLFLVLFCSYILMCLVVTSRFLSLSFPTLFFVHAADPIN